MTSIPDATHDQTPAAGGGADVGEVIQLVKDYARQETLGPLRGAGRWLGLGIAAAVCLAIGALFLVLGALRLVQTETDDAFRGPWMQLIPYVVALAVAVVIIVIAVQRISRPTLQPTAPSTSTGSARTRSKKDS